MNPFKNFLAMMLARFGKLAESSRGQVATLIGGLIVGIVMLFMGVFMAATVSNATNVENTTQAFEDMHNNLVTQTGTIMTVLGLVIIVVALSAAIASLRGVAGGR